MRYFTLILVLLLTLTACGEKRLSRTTMQGPSPDTPAWDYWQSLPPERKADGPPRDSQRERGVGRFIPFGEPAKIALLVPMSGPYKKLGQQAIDAAQLAVFELDATHIEVIPFDTKGTGHGAAEAAQQAIDQGAKLILGPIFAQGAREAAAVASPQHVNVVSFSNDSNLADSGAFAMGYFPQDQMYRIVNYALDRGIKDFVSIMPGNNYGGLAAKAIRNEVEKNGEAVVLKSSLYQVDKKQRPVNLKRYVYPAYKASLNYPSNRREKDKAFDPIYNYPRGLIITDGGGRLKKIATYLDGYDINRDKVQLLGTHSWYDDSILGLPALEGAWFPALPKERREGFETTFEENYDYKPSAISGLVYDSVALAATLSYMSGGKDFSRKVMMDPRGFMGLDGIFRFNRQGLAERGFAIMTIRNGHFETLDPAPESFIYYVGYEEAKEEGAQE